MVNAEPLVPDGLQPLPLFHVVAEGFPDKFAHGAALSWRRTKAPLSCPHGPIVIRCWPRRAVGPFATMPVKLSMVPISRSYQPVTWQVGTSTRL